MRNVNNQWETILTVIVIVVVVVVVTETVAVIQHLAVAITHKSCGCCLRRNDHRI